jgi:hypothetical protein
MRCQIEKAAYAWHCASRATFSPAWSIATHEAPAQVHVFVCVPAADIKENERSCPLIGDISRLLLLHWGFFALQAYP